MYINTGKGCAFQNQNTNLLLTGPAAIAFYEVKCPTKARFVFRLVLIIERTIIAVSLTASALCILRISLALVTGQNARSSCLRLRTHSLFVAFTRITHARPSIARDFIPCSMRFELLALPLSSFFKTRKLFGDCSSVCLRC
jgi:hypothetical protein